MAKNICVICNNPVGMLSGKIKIQDGVVCLKCLARAGMTGMYSLPNNKSHTTASIQELIRSFRVFKPIEL